MRQDDKDCGMHSKSDGPQKRNHQGKNGRWPTADSGHVPGKGVRIEQIKKAKKADHVEGLAKSAQSAAYGDQRQAGHEDDQVQAN